jgi:hypothetical protein
MYTHSVRSAVAGPRQWQQHGLGPCWGCARTRAVPGCPGPRRGRAVRGAPAFRARGTTAAAEGDSVRGSEQRRDGLLQGKWHGGRRGRGILRFTTEGSSAAKAHAGSTGKEGTAAVILTGGAEGERAGAVAGRGRRVVAVQGDPRRRCRRTGRRLGEAPAWRRPRAPPRAALLLLFLRSSLSSSGYGGGKEARVSRVWAKRPRVYRGGARVRGGCGRGSSAAGPGRVAPLRWLRRGVGSRARGAGCREKGARRLHCPVVERRQERAGVTQASAGAGKRRRPFR